MNYGSTIRTAWQLTWRHRFLWILGLFVPSTVANWSAGSGQRAGSTPVTGANSGNGGTIPPEVAGAMGEAGRWVGANWGIILAAIGLMLVIGLAFLVISLIAQGGMAHATVALAQGQPVTLGTAWRRGVALIWRFVGLWLILLGLGMLLALVLGATAATLVAAVGTASELWAALVLLVLAMIAIVVPVAIGVTITATFAQRAMVTGDYGPIAGLRQGWHVLRDHLGTSALAWLIAVGLGIAASVVIGLGVLATLVLLALPAVGLFVTGGLSASLIAYAVVALLAIVAAGWLMSAIANTFFWTYWSLVYVQLTEPPTAMAELPLAA
jgi:hypothetical protein